MKNLLYFLAVAMLFSSCGGDTKNEFRNDFDQIADWGFSSPMLKKGSAHSGVYYCGLDSSNEFSITFQRAVKDLPNSTFKVVNISAWIRVRSLDTKAALVLTLDSDKGNVKYQGIALKDFATETNNWVRLNGTFDAPPDINPNLYFKVYLYNVGKENVDIDDIEFEVK